MKKRTLLAMLFTMIVFIAYSENRVMYIQNNQIKAGFLPDVGGRMVFFSSVNGENFLYSDSVFWNEPESNRIEVKPNAPFKPYNGLITWVGPQSHWWTQQDILKNKKDRKDLWPPDPYLIYSNFKIIEKTDTSIVLEGPESPVSGLRLTKKFTLIGNCLEIEVTGYNCRNTNVSWDLWSNARFDAFTRFRVPVKEEGILKMQEVESNRLEIMSYQLDNGYFTYLPSLPDDPAKMRISKAFLYPDEGRFLVEKPGFLLLIEFEKVPLEAIHPEQAWVEVYNSVDQSGISNLLELEHHSAYRTLKPGEEMVLQETWRIEPQQ